METGDAGMAFDTKAPAKVNLFLEVLGKRADGYHDISSVIVPLSLHDQLKFEKTNRHIELVCNDEGIPTGDDNLVVQAARLLRSVHSVEAGARITLEKGIPAAAGLGGGSSDAAATLAALNHLWELQLGVEDLMPLASRLGADVPFFIHGRLAYVRGTGEKVMPLESIQGELYFAIAVPDFGVSTSSVYRCVRVPSAEQRRSASGMIEGFLMGDGELVVRNAYNRLQEAAVEVEPRLKEFYDSLTEATDMTVTMSGSGSAFFVCCGSSQEAEEVSRVWEDVAGARVFTAVSQANRQSLAPTTGGV